MSDLDQILNGEQPAPEPEPTQEAAPELAQPEPAPEPEPTPQPEPQPAPEMVPASVVGQLRQEIRGLKAELTQPAPTPPPDFIDPEGASFIAKQFRGSMQNMRLDMSEEMARTSNGDEAVDAAFQALQASQDPVAYKTIMAARSPWQEMVKWHSKQQVAAEIGGDPAAYKAKVEAEIRAKVEAEMVAKQVTAAAGKPAPSMANVTGIGGGPNTTWAGPTSLDRLFKD